jgi:hypothetical protein
MLLGLLLVANLLLFLYGYLGLDQGDEKPPERVHEPDVGSIRLLDARVVGAVSPPQVAEPALPGERSLPEEEQPEIARQLEPAPQAVAPVLAEQEQASFAEEVAEPLAPELPAVSVKGNTQESSSKESGRAEAVALQEEPPEATVPEASVKESPSLYCGVVGPLKSRFQAERIQRKLGSPGDIRIVQKPTLVDKAYWVLIPALPDRKKAREVLQKLKAKGITDLWLIPKGELENAVSLGLYSRRKAAYDHAKNLRRKGFKVTVRPKQEELPRYWLEFSGLATEALERLTPDVLPKGAGVKKNRCEQASAAP